MENPADQSLADLRAAPVSPAATRAMLAVVCLLIAGVYAALADLKGIGTDEGFRLGIINGGREFTTDERGTRATWDDVLQANSHYAYQPLYFLIQNTVMHVGQTHDESVLKGVNIFFLWLSLQGLLALSRGWRLLPRLFLLGLFSLNAYLFMHVLQLREYIMAIAFYVWSSWLTLQLDRRPLGRAWVDVGWFAAYGVLLVAGFFTQTWVVFPAIGQGLFLVARRAGDRLRFYAHLALSYVIVLSVAWPYLETHQGKVNVGRWGTAGTPLWPQLSDGFHLVLVGHVAGYSTPTDFLFWFWLFFLVIGAGLLARKKFQPGGNPSHQDCKREGLLMLLCLGVSVAFQIGYFLKVDTLSVWPRYFALHYFFVIWLVVLAFKRLYDLATSPALSALTRGVLKLAVAIVLTVMIFSGIFQTRRYWRQPYFDSELRADYNWRLVSAGLAHIIQPGDVVLTQDFLHAWTLTFTRPVPNRVIPVTQLKAHDLDSAGRIVYLESAGNLAARGALVDHLVGLGFGTVQEKGLLSADGNGDMPAWRVLIFNRQ